MATVQSLWSKHASNPLQIYTIVRDKISTMDRNQLAFTSLMLVFLIWNIYNTFKQTRAQRLKSLTLPAPGFPEIVPVEKTFQWDKTQPLKFRPFKPKYHLTMALETLDPSELIPMDNTYRDRLIYRRSLLKRFHDIVVAVNKPNNKDNKNNDNDDNKQDNEDGGEEKNTDPRIRGAVAELYTWIMGTYLPGRYPSMFILHRTKYETGPTVMLENRVMGELYPAEFKVEDKMMKTIRALEILLKNVDEDFLLLLPELSTPDAASSSGADGGDNSGRPEEGQTKYVLHAYSTCYPAGFNPAEKLGKRLAKIHEPVPGYPDKLEKSMDRFFEKLEVGKYVRRVNWSITTNSELFAAFGGLHTYAGDKGQDEPIKPGDLDLDSTCLRCERQTLHRLPHSKALVFAFHTYTYPIREVKAEIDEARKEARLADSDSASKEGVTKMETDLATAIDGLKEGNSPGIHHYKRGPIWGEAVKAYLRS